MTFYTIVWTILGHFTYADSNEQAQAYIRQRVPGAYFSKPRITSTGQQIPVWLSAGHELRSSLGERDEFTMKPFALIVQSKKPIRNLRKSNNNEIELIT